MKKNITLDFSSSQQMENLTSNQPLAIMPAELAKKLLRMYADSLFATDTRTIITDHIDILTARAKDNDLPGAINASLSWIVERELISNVVNGNWSAYEVAEKVEAVAH